MAKLQSLSQTSLGLDPTITTSGVVPVQKPAVIVISSHVVRGSVGSRASAFALEVCGYPVWIVPTVTLPWHPGHGPASRVVPPAESFATMLLELSTSPWIGEVGAVLSGYLGDESQVDAVAGLVGKIRAKNAGATYLLDPVMGDGGQLYIPESTAQSMRERLLPIADIVTPNRFELGWLTDSSGLERNESMLEAAASLGVQTVLVTSAEAMMRNNTANLLLHEGKAWLAEHMAMDGPANGFGDLTSALMLANWLGRGTAGPEAALARTTASVHEAMALSTRAGADELLLEQAVGSLLKPRTQIDVRSLRPQGR